jgi:hypothetical protein
MITAIIDTISTDCSESSVLGDQLKIEQVVDIITINPFYMKNSLYKTEMNSKDISTKL